MRRRLVDAGRALLEVGGVEAVTMRKVAAKVGVAPTAIYWHVGSREDLLNQILDEMIAGMPPVTVRGRTPRSRVASLARCVHEQVRATSSTRRLAQHLGRSGELFLPAQVALAREITAAGLRGRRAAEAIRAVLFVVGGFTVLEDSYERGEPVADSIRELWRSVDDPKVDDGLRAAMCRPAGPAELFDFTLEQVLASVLPTRP
jgi:AcrR family transcriptional regulator